MIPAHEHRRSSLDSVLCGALINDGMPWVHDETIIMAGPFLGFSCMASLHRALLPLVTTAAHIDCLHRDTLNCTAQLYCLSDSGD